MGWGMRAITQYQAFDGTVFGTEDDCRAYEVMSAKIHAAMRALPSKPDSSEFANGAGYIQHDSASINEAMMGVLEQAKKYSGHRSIVDSMEIGFPARRGIVGRIIDDCCPRPINMAWYRFMCTDDDYREWGQPYFALNPDKGEQKRIVP